MFLVVGQFVELRLVQVQSSEQVGLDGKVALEAMSVDFAFVGDAPVYALVFVLFLDFLSSHELARCLVGREVGIVLQHVQVLLFQLLLRELPVLALDYLCKFVVFLGLLVVHLLLVLRTP